MVPTTYELQTRIEMHKKVLQDRRDLSNKVEKFLSPINDFLPGVAVAVLREWALSDGTFLDVAVLIKYSSLETSEGEEGDAEFRLKIAWSWTDFSTREGTLLSTNHILLARGLREAVRMSMAEVLESRTVS